MLSIDKFSGSCPLSCLAIPGLISAAEHYDLPDLIQVLIGNNKSIYAFMYILIVERILISKQKHKFKIYEQKSLILNNFEVPFFQASFHHAKQFIRTEIACQMLCSLENYCWRYCAASELVNMILAFIETR